MIITSSDTWSTATPVSREELIKRVGSTYGLDTDTDTAEFKPRVLAFLDEAVNDLNAFLFDFNKLSVSGITLTEGDETVPLPATFYKESTCTLIKTGDTIGEVLAYIPYVHFVKLKATRYPTRPDIPFWYSLRNVEREGLLYLWPPPNADVAANYTLILEYYRRVPLVSEEDPLVVPREVQSYLMYNAQKRLALHLLGAGHPDVAALNALEEKALHRLRDIDQAHVDEQARFRMPWEVYGKRRLHMPIPTGTIYIKL